MEVIGAVQLFIELDDLKKKTTDKGYAKSRIVCAAIEYNGTIILGPRHFDMTMHKALDILPSGLIPGRHGSWRQGFVDQFGNYLSRKAAYIIAKENGQIRKKSGNADSTELFSEDLY